MWFIVYFLYNFSVLFLVLPSEIESVQLLMSFTFTQILRLIDSLYHLDLTLFFYVIDVLCVTKDGFCVKFMFLCFSDFPLPPYVS